MKRFYKITVSCIAAGLVLIGAGSAVAVWEVKGFQYMGDKYDNKAAVTESMEVELPDNLAKIYRRGYGADFKLVKDEGLEGNNAVLEYTHSANETIEISFDIDENYYLYNTFTEKFSKYCINGIEIGFGRESNYDISGLDEFKQGLADLKKREIYSYDRYGNEPEFTLKVSPEGYERFAEIPEGYDIYSYSGYMSRMEEIQDNESKAQG